VNWFRNPDWWMVILTAFLFVVGVVTLVVFYRQFREMKAQTSILNTQAQQAAADSIESAKRVERQLAIADKQAKAAQATADAAYRSIRATIESDRPWIASNGITVQGATLEEIHVTAHFLNAGRSPARIIETKFGTEVYSTFPEKPRYPTPKSRPSRLLLIPGRQVTSAEPVPPLTPEDIQEIKSHSKTLYFYGFAKYEDLRTHEVHKTKFCWFYLDKDSVTVCEGHNDAD